MAKAQYKFFKQTTKIEETIKSSYDELKEWHPDSKGYFLIRINPQKKRIEVGFVTYKHLIIKAIYGSYAIEIYNTIIKHNLITRLEHAAYLGKELYKAELALKYKKEYRQEFPLNFPELKVSIKLKKESYDHN